MQTINLDISCCGDAPQPVLQAKQGDVGRKFKAVITDNGQSYAIPAGTGVSLWYSGTSGEGNYTQIGDKSAVSVSGNAITVELIAQMLTAPGGGTLCLVLGSRTGEQLGLWNIHYWVEAVPGADSEAAKAYYTAFSESVGAVLNVPKIMESTEIPGAFYHMVDGEKEWLNPPLSPGRGEFRTIQRYGTLPLYAQMIDYGALPNKTYSMLDIGIPAPRVIRMEGWVKKADGSLKYPLPMGSTDKVHAYMMINSDGMLTIRTMADYSDWTARVTIWYYKG